MPFPNTTTMRVLRMISMGTVILLLCWGIVMSLFPVEPFWIDEWRLIYNLKFKSTEALWGSLAFTQQFPRVYLTLTKWWTAAFDYSYTSLRLPAYLISICSLLLCRHLGQKLYPQQPHYRLLWIMILVSSFTFTEYLVQIKQYAMEILLGLLAVWQTDALIRIRTIPSSRYLLLCVSMLFAPFFSYTYPIAIAPAFVVAIGCVFYRSQPERRPFGIHPVWLPLICSSVAMLVFYSIDVAQLLQDDDMHRYWQYRMMGNEFRVSSLAVSVWQLFARTGSGLVYEVVFGICGLTAWVLSVGSLVRQFRSGKMDYTGWIVLYAALLIAGAILLFAIGKLPVGEAKFNAFAVPAIIILLLTGMQQMQGIVWFHRAIPTVWFILYIGVTGNILSTIIGTYTAPEYARRVAVYHATEQAVRLAQAEGVPLVVTSGVAYPDQIDHYTPYLVSMHADEVLKTFPAYRVSEDIPVYRMADISDTVGLWHMLPTTVTSVIAGDGLHYRLIQRNQANPD